MKLFVIIMIAVVLLFVPNTVFATHTPFDVIDVYFTTLKILIFVVPPALITGITIFVIYRHRKGKRKEKQQDSEIKKLKDRIDELEKDKEKKG